MISGVFENYQGLTIIQMENSQLTSIPTGFAFNCQNLLYIYFNDGLITDIGEGKNHTLIYNWFLNFNEQGLF